MLLLISRNTSGWWLRSNSKRLLPRANNPLNRAAGFLLRMCDGPKAANEKVLEILDTIDNLAIFPELGPSLKGKIDSLSRYRCLSVSNCIVFYRIELDKVLIVRILNSRMDYLKVLEL